MRARLIALCFMLFSCKSDKHKAFERLAAEANPLLLAIRPTVVKIFEITGDDPAATAKIIEACQSADEALWQLRHVKFDDDSFPLDDRSPTVATYAAELLDRRSFFCHRGEPADCKEWCLDTWAGLVSRAGDLHAGASKEGVEIVLLSSLTKKQAYEQVARELNPILTALKPTAALMLRDLPAMKNTPASTAKIIATCGADQALRRLQDVKFDIQNRSISKFAEVLLYMPKRACLTSSDTDMSPEQCREKCLDAWNYLREEVDKLRRAANREGVEVVQMFP